MWLNLQKLYELRLAEAKTGELITSLPVLDRALWEARGLATRRKPLPHPYPP